MMAGSHDPGRGTPAHERAPLPFVGRVAPLDGGWSVFVPVSAERCDVEKHTVEYERVRVRLDRREDVQRVSASVRREELRVDPEERPRHDRPTVRIRRAPSFDETTDSE